MARDFLLPQERYLPTFEPSPGWEQEDELDAQAWQEAEPENVDGLVVPYTSGCGGPTYGWTPDGRILIGGAAPRRALPSGVPPWFELVEFYADKHKLMTHFVLGVMSLESGGNANAGSPAGAKGLMQLMTSTANMLAGRSMTAEEIFDPDTNVDLGCKLLRQLLDKYKDDPIKATFAYNAGSARCGAGCVRDYKAQGMPCIAECSGNQFGLKADCYSSTYQTVDYGGIVAAFSNEALAQGLASFGEKPSPDGNSSSSSSAAKWVLPVGLFALGGAVLYVNRNKVFGPPLEEQRVW